MNGVRPPEADTVRFARFLAVLELCPPCKAYSRSVRDDVSTPLGGRYPPGWAPLLKALHVYQCSFCLRRSSHGRSPKAAEGRSPAMPQV